MTIKITGNATIKVDGKTLTEAEANKMFTKQPQCSYLCPPHLARCTRQTNEHGGCHEGDCACELCPRTTA